MATVFERWEKDPFFPAAEAVQNSADSMESVYRLSVQAPSRVLPGELHSALATAKWQLEELERAVTASDGGGSAGEDTRERHRQFVAAIKDRISVVEGSISGEAGMTWVRLDEGERDELAAFLAGDSTPTASVSDGYSRVSGHGGDDGSSSGTDNGAVKIVVSSEESVTDERPNRAPPVLSFPGLTGAVEDVGKTRWYRNGFRKWRTGYQHDAMRNRDIEACYDRSKSCLSNCDDFDEKQLDGWAGAIHRQLQRSQYQFQYGRPVQMIFWAVVTIILIAVFVLRAY